MTKILKSKDEALFRENKWIWDEEFRFLDKSESLSRDHGNHVCFTSYMRSGNAFLRRYMEQVSGITTGGAIHLHTSTSLQIMGMKGESYTDDSTWIVRSHHPFEYSVLNNFNANKLLMIVRHPLDVFPSYASLS